METIGKRIKHYRKLKGYTQKQLGDILGVTNVMINQYENGARNPKIESVIKMSAALGIDSELLINDYSEFNQKLNFYVEKMSNIFGYDIIGDPAEGYIVLKSPNGEYEITEEDAADLRRSTASFIKFKLQELQNKSRKIGK